MTDTQLIAHLVSALVDAHDAIDGYVDVVDGSYGEPAPNWAMRLQTDLDEAIKVGERRLKTVPVDPKHTVARTTEDLLYWRSYFGINESMTAEQVKARLMSFDHKEGP